MLRRIIALILALGALMGLSAGFCASALADGDPASDVLPYAAVFHPQQLNATPTQIAQLDALVAYVTRAGYPLKVAMIPAEVDLGTVTQLWENHDGYAIYLGKELSLLTHANLLVAMPSGYGLRTLSARPSAGDETWSDHVIAPGNALIEGTYAQIVALARDNGITVPDRFAVAVAPHDTGSIALAPLLVFLAGLLLVLGAWGASLRVRPLRRRPLAA